MFDAGVEVFDVFTDDDEVESASGEWGLDAGEFFDGPDVAVSFEEFSQGDVGRFFAEADRGFEWAFEDQAGAGDGLDGFFWDSGGDAGAEHGGSCMGDFPIEDDA